MSAQLTLFAPAPAPAPKPAPMRDLYRGIGADALRVYLDFNGKRGRRWKSRRRAAQEAEARRITRRELVEHALAMIDVEAILWPRDVQPFIERNAQLLAALYAERDEREEQS